MNNSKVLEDFSIEELQDGLDVLKALSIEELQERNEFSAAPDGFSHCVICEC